MLSIFSEALALRISRAASATTSLITALAIVEATSSGVPLTLLNSTASISSSEYVSKDLGLESGPRLLHAEIVYDDGGWLLALGRPGRFGFGLFHAGEQFREIISAAFLFNNNFGFVDHHPFDIVGFVIGPPPQCR